ncbi:hypothetical protein N7463_009012 [Penicillium fimorum]|uniref:Large ribosomal subunit protein mL50 n=1 Tax=Penicillium fimorum TaxID=1882269 RepID=A0A9W9XQT8_9EURO|nr:hypothetical protein N7463_009012 [Penicillium fimorum]
MIDLQCQSPGLEGASSTLSNNVRAHLNNATFNAPPSAGGKLYLFQLQNWSHPRISPLGQVRRYASEEPGVLERARRKLWGTDNPPGPADPYSGSQIMPGSNMTPGEPSAGETKADEAFSLQEGEAPSKELDESLTWEGMPKIGYLKEKEWRIRGSNGEADKVTPWYHNPEPIPYMKAAHQAAVEIGLMQLLGKKITVVSQLHSREIQDQLDMVKIEGDSANWGDSLRFPDNKTMESLLQNVAGPAYGEEMTEVAFKKQLEKITGTAGNRLYDPETKDQKSSLNSLSLADGNIKFAYFARLSKLTSQRISDSIISSTTTGEVLTAQEELLKKTARLTPVILHELMDKNGAAKLSNVKISDVRQTRHDNDEDLGRKKVIVSALYKGGLISKPLGQKKLPPWKQAKKTEANA